MIGFILEEKKSIVFLYWFFTLYVQCDLGKILKERCCNGFQNVWREISGNNIGWYSIFAGFSTGLFVSGAAGKAIGGVAVSLTSRAAIGAVADGAGLFTGRAAGRAANCNAGRTAGRAASSSAGRSACRAADIGAGRVAGIGTCRTISDDAGETVGRAVNVGTGRVAGGDAGKAVGGDIGRATDGGKILST